jgi:hypothetical protein
MIADDAIGSAHVSIGHRVTDTPAPLDGAAIKRSQKTAL